MLARYPVLRRFGMINLLAIDNGSKATLGILLVAISISLLANYLGLHPAIGAYMAGLIIKEEYFHFGNKENKDACTRIPVRLSMMLPSHGLVLSFSLTWAPNSSLTRAFSLPSWVIA